MPLQPRYAVKQKLTSASNELEKAMTKIAEAGSLYEKDHPDLFAKFQHFFVYLNECNEALKAFSLEL